MSRTTATAADALVIFGITGDLARKMTFRSLYRLEVADRLDCPIIGVAMDDWSEDHLRAMVLEAVTADQDVVDEVAFHRLAGRLSYLKGDFTDREHVAAVQVTLAEDFGVEDRGAFYDSVGALRDVVQNHLLQVLALVTMEAPVGPGHRALWDRKADIFRAMADVDPARCVRGQYAGYSKVPGVKRESATETYVALRLEVQNARWAGVPFFIRAGKALAACATEVRVIFRRPPRLSFLDEPRHTNANQLIIRIDPDPGLRLVMLSKGSDGRASKDVHMDLSFATELGRPPGPYERLLHDALIGDHSLFTMEDSVEETWRVLQPLVDHPPAPLPYLTGSWGPHEGDEILRGHPPWQLPWLPDAKNQED